MPSQVSVVHGFPSSVQSVPFPFFASLGQAAAAPVQFSARSHSPAEPRQTAVEERKASPGQVTPVPVQCSATSQMPATARQVVVDDAKPSPGQLELVPVQVSVTSQMPAELRQTVPALPAGCVQLLPVPSQTSVVQTLPSSVQSEPLGFFASAGHGVPGVAVQFSATSHSPAADRHVNEIGRTTSGGHVVVTPVHISAGSQTSPEPVRQTAPAFPAGCWQASFVPSH